MIRRTIDVVVAAISLAVLAAPGLVIALCIRLGSRGAALHRATRVGQNGQTFTMWKFRTMHVGADAGSGITQAGDARITRIGRLLRRVHLDELPQLWNVLRGDMSLVGPRPEDPRFVELADSQWTRVLAVRPGLTGPTQLRFRGREDALVAGDDPERAYRERVLPQKLARDVAYVEQRAGRHDVRVVAQTLAAVFAPRRVRA